jgi:hypothetical protein
MLGFGHIGHVEIWLKSLEFYHDLDIDKFELFVILPLDGHMYIYHEMV